MKGQGGNGSYDGIIEVKAQEWAMQNEARIEREESKVVEMRSANIPVHISESNSLFNSQKSKTEV